MLFFELLQVAIGNRNELSQTPSEEEWRELYLCARKQAMVGIAFRGIELLPDMQRPPKSLLMQWYMATEQIRSMNFDLDSKALKVANTFLEDGFPNVILKGQGIAQYYSEAELENYRMPGDIDVWLNGSRSDILSYVRKYVPNSVVVYHHADFLMIDGAEVEVHFTPSWMNSPVTNRRLQQWFGTFNFQTVPLFIGGRVEQSGAEGVASVARRMNYTEIPSPDIAFNRVYILVHIYRHLFHEGIGLRQLMDYYFVLQQGFTEEEREETMRVLRSLKMQRFTAAVMWVLQTVFHMDERYLLTMPNEREGQFLLDEIMLAGNFGQYDERLQHERGETALHWALRKIKRNFRFVRSYPSEVLWSPAFKLWHYFWRKLV